MNLSYQTAPTTIYRKVDGELIVINLDSGKIYYFSEEAESLLEQFKQPQRIEDFHRDGCGPTVSAEDLIPLFEKLRKFNLVQSCEATEKQRSASKKRLTSVPTFLREGKQTLDEITFLCP